MKLTVLFFILTLFFACENTSSFQHKEGLMFKLIDQKMDLIPFMEERGFGKKEIYYITKMGYQNYCLIQISNYSGSDIYFQTCDSILRAVSSYSTNVGRLEHTEMNFYNHFKNCQISRIPKNKKGYYFYIFKANAETFTNKIDTMKTSFNYTNFPFSKLKSSMPVGDVILTFSFDPEKKIKLVSTLTLKPIANWDYPN